MNRYLKILLFVLAALVCVQQGQARDNNETETQEDEYDETNVSDLCSDDGTLFVDFSTLESALREVLEDGRDAHEEDGMKDAEVKKWRIAGALNDGLQTVLIAACLVLVIIALRKIDRLKRDTRERLHTRLATTASGPYPAAHQQHPSYQTLQNENAKQVNVPPKSNFSKPKENIPNDNSSPVAKQNQAKISCYKLYAEGQDGGGTLKASRNPEGKIYCIILQNENATTGEFRVNENCDIMEEILSDYNSYLAGCEITEISSRPKRIENTKPGKVEKNPDGTWRVVGKAQVILR